MDVEIVLVVVAGIIFGVWCFQWCIHITAIIYGKLKLHRKTAALLPESIVGVSILKPLVGIDQNLFSNLETFFNMDYPQYELLFCLEEEMDPAVMVVRSLLAKYPKVDARLFVGAKRVGVNPKINNMIQGYDAAQYDLIVISDSGIRMKEDTLTNMVSALDEKTGLVHQIPFVCDREGFAAVLEKVHFGTQHAKMYLDCDLLGINCVTGMSCLFRKAVLEAAGGLKILGAFLAEDYHLGNLYRDNGWKTRICSQPAMQNAGNYSVATLHSRLMRWTKIRGSLVPTTMLLEPITECLLLGLGASWAVSLLFNWSALAFFFVHVLIWFLLDYLMLLVVQGGSLPFSKLEYVLGWLFRELTSVPLMLKAHSTRYLTWRSKTYVLKRGGVGEEVKVRLFV